MISVPVPVPLPVPAAPPVAGPVLVSTAAEFIAAVTAVSGPTVVIEPYRPSWLQRVAGRTGWAR